MPFLTLISDLLLIFATIGLAVWCRLLTVRLRGFDDIDKGVEATIAALRLQVEDLTTSVAAAAADTADRAATITAANAQADDRIGRMEILLASLEDLEEKSADQLLRDAAPAEEIARLPSFRAARAPSAEGRF